MDFSGLRAKSAWEETKFVGLRDFIVNNTCYLRRSTTRMVRLYYRDRRHMIGSPRRKTRANGRLQSRKQWKRSRRYGDTNTNSPQTFTTDDRSLHREPLIGEPVADTTATARGDSWMEMVGRGSRFKPDERCVEEAGITRKQMYLSCIGCSPFPWPVILRCSLFCFGTCSSLFLGFIASVFPPCIHSLSVFLSLQCCTGAAWCQISVWLTDESSCPNTMVRHDMAALTSTLTASCFALCMGACISFT